MPTRIIGDMIRSKPTYIAGPTTSVADAARGMKTIGVSAALVVEGGHLIGIFTERDALFKVIAEGLDPATTPVYRVMTHDPLTIRPEKCFGHALHLMAENGFRHVPVVVDGKPLGLVSARDALDSDISGFLAEMQRKEELAAILG